MTKNLLKKTTDKGGEVSPLAVNSSSSPSAPPVRFSVLPLEELPAGWQILALERLVTFFSGGTPSTSKSEYWDGIIPWVSAKDLKSDWLVDTIDHLSEEGIKNGTRMVGPGTVLILTRGMTLLNDIPVCFVKRDMAFNQDIKALVCNDNILPEFLFYSLKAKKNELLTNVELAGHGTGKLSTDILMNLQIMLPPLHIQENIVTMLSSLDHKITLNRAINQTLEQIAQALFKSWFIDFDPVHAKTRGELPVGMDDSTAALFADSFQESELGIIPKGWTVNNFFDHCEPKKGKNITKENTEVGSVPVVAGGLSPAYFHSVSNVSGPVITISASGANAGFVNLYFSDIWASDCSYINRAMNPFLFTNYILLKAKQTDITQMQQGAAQPHVYPKDFKRLLFCYPGDKLFQVFENKVQSMFCFFSKNTYENQSLEQIRDALLPRLLSGEISVKNIPTIEQGF